MDSTVIRASYLWSYTSSFIRLSIFGVILGVLLVLASCVKKEAPGQHATILMRDGTSMSGTVTATSPDQITVMMNVDFRDDILAGEVERSVVEIENDARERWPQVRRLFVRPMQGAGEQRKHL